MNIQPNNKLMDTIMASQRQEDISSINVPNMINKAFGGLKRKQRHVLKRRFGLVGNESKTLQEIGESFGVTRERIRQIEKSAIKRLSKEVNFKYFSPVSSVIIYELEQSGGLLSEESIVRKLLGDNYEEIDANGLRLILEVHPEIFQVKECDYKKSSWSLENYDVNKLIKIIIDIEDFLRSEQNVVSVNKLHGTLGERFNIDKNHLVSILDVSRSIMRTSDDVYGLVEWSSINPKNIRDKIYYVFSKYSKPMHFLEITDFISKEDFAYKKKITHQAVHNELISDKRYVLIGKGIYALKEWGYEPGTVSEVIAKILRENGKPMTKEEIVSAVQKKRVVKNNTIVINLHNKNNFVRQDANMYWIKEN